MTSTASLARTNAMRFVMLLGFVSFLADVTCEDPRSIRGPYLGIHGASGAVVGFAIVAQIASLPLILSATRMSRSAIPSTP